MNMLFVIANHKNQTKNISNNTHEEHLISVITFG